jgi:hypothetical protein
MKTGFSIFILYIVIISLIILLGNYGSVILSLLGLGK